MKQALLILLIFQFSFSALGAKSKKYWYKVESKKQEKKSTNQTPYPYDSVEKQLPNKKFREIGFWSLRPKVALSGGFHADKAVFEDDKTNRFFFNSALYFRQRPWHRFAINALILQNNSAFVGGEWQFTPSRESSRNYYGAGIAHLLVSEKEFSNIVEFDAYYLTATFGREFLLQSQHAWFAEAKAYISSENYALQIGVGYIIPF